MLRAGSSQGIVFILTAFDRSELPAKYHSFVHGVTLQMNDRMDYADALAVRIPVEWGGIREYPGRDMIARVDKEAKQTHVYEIQTAVYGTAESDALRSGQIRQLGMEMRQCWNGRKPLHISRIPQQPLLSLLLNDEHLTGDTAAADRLPFGYDKSTGMPFSLDLREMFSLLICGPRKSGKLNTLLNLATAFACKNAQIHLIGSQELVDWARAHGMNGYLPAADEWKLAFNKLFSVEIPRRKVLLAKAREEGGPEARAKLLETLQPVVILIEDLNTYIEANGETHDVVINLRHFSEDKVSGYGVYTFATLSHTAFAQTRLKTVVTSMVQAGRGLMLQGKLNDCDPFNVPLPFSRKSASYPLGEALLIANQETQHVVLPKWDETPVPGEGC